MPDPESEASKAGLKKRIASAAGVNEKTVERQSKNLIALLFGVSEKDLEDPALRAYVRYLEFDEDPAPYITLDPDERKRLDEKKKAMSG